VTPGYQMRRHARRMRRYGLQPMIVMSPGDRLPDLVVVVLARWAWRYRSELAPFTVAVADATAAWALHATRPHWWAYIAAATTAATAAAAMLGRKFGLLTIGERIYAAGVAGTAGGWLAAATAIGPWQSPLPQVVVVAGLVLAVPWWTHRRRRARVRVERTLTAWPEIAQSVGLPGSRVMSAVVDLWGWRARVGLARGQTIADVLAKLPAIESALGTTRGAARAYPTPDNLAHRVELRILEIDPHADAIPWPGPSVTSITQPIDLGPFEDAAPCRVLVLRRHGLFGGTSGSGKSGGVNVLMGNLTACADVVIWAIDLKRGMELQPWASCLGRLATTPAQALMLLRDAVAVLEARAGYLTATGQRVWEPSPDMPALIIVIDEYAELADDVTSYTDSIARRGRAPAVTLIAATQRPTQKAMGQGSVRSQMDVRICFRVRERRDVDLILGPGMLTAGWDAHKLNAPGKFLISAPEHETPRRARAYLLTDDMVAATAARHAPPRPALDAISQAAIDERAQARPDEPGHTALSDHADDDGRSPEDDRGAPEAILWAILCIAPPEGATVPDLMEQTGMSRPWVYQRLSDMARRGHVIQVSRGRWRASGDAQ
jgi:FtsK/SpoIIIE family